MSTAKQDIEALRKQQEALLTSEKRNLWVSPSDLNADQNTQASARGQEFSVLPINKEFAEGAKVESSSMSRRRFLQFSAAASALVSTAACTRRPVDHLVPYTKKPVGLTYGVPMWYASSAANGFGVLVKTREGKPIKLEGNTDHPVNQGGLDSHTQASLFELYNPERLKGPSDIKTGRALSWKEVDDAVAQAISQATPGSVRVLTGPLLSPMAKQSLRSFLNTSKGEHHVYEDLPSDPIVRAMEVVTGQKFVPSFRFDKADVVVSIDADFLGTWLRPAEFIKQFSKVRAVHEGQTNPVRLYSFESGYTTTGIAADHRQAIKPTQALAVLLALGNEVSKLRSADAGASSLFGRYSVEKLSKDFGISVDLVRQAAKDLSAARGKSLVVAGGAGPQALELQVAALALNSILGNFGTTLETDRAMILGTESGSDFSKLLADMKAGKVEVLIMNGVNPAYSVGHLGFADALSKVKVVATLAPQVDETVSASTYALPESHFLESWGDSEIREGVFTIQQPVIEPLYDSRSFAELMTRWSGTTVKNFRDQVMASWQKFSQGDFSSWWQNQLKDGVYIAAPSRRSFAPRWAAASALIDGAKISSTNGFEIVLYPSCNLGSGANANNPYLQELPDPVTKVTWDNYLGVSPKLAEKMELNRHHGGALASDFRSDLCEVTMGSLVATLPVFVQAGLRDDVVVVALGYGRKVAGSIGSNVGVNMYPFVVDGDFPQTRGQSVSIKKVSGKYELACTQKQFDIHGRDSDILQQHTLKDFLAMGSGHGHEGKKHAVFSIYDEKEFVYPGQKWGMAIDLNKCTGCNACVVACYVENNVSTVGRDEVIMGRHQAWLRMDLYHSGDPENPESAFEPMLCQHCDNAPCETVCPVLATVHSSDGLNDMSYNRCVGTRYCANNCPYKVRRFNWFQYSDKLANTVTKEDPLPMLINPDVTVRSRGVMEKCTFCVQRIRTEVKDRMARVKDGSIKTACQQSCPADAISFGDLNDHESRVSQMAKKGGAFKVLEVLNTRPNITYLPRIRNKESAV